MAPPLKPRRHPYETPGVVRTVLLAALLLANQPAMAQLDLSGNWASRLHEDSQAREAGPNQVEYYGMPINADARARALSTTPTSIDVPEHQCQYYGPLYLLEGPFALQISHQDDPVTGKPISWTIGPWVDRAPMKIWVDGRPDPGPQAPHTVGGFSTGVWRGDTLVVHTTHLKESLLARNGVPTSDRAKITFYISRHGELLNITGIIDDPVYLTEPYVQSRIWKLDPYVPITNPVACTPTNELPELAGHAVPQYFPGENPQRNEVTQLYHIPLDAVMGGASTMYPEYRDRMQAGYTPPAMCTRYCCVWGGPPGNDSTLLKCKGGIFGGFK